MTCKLPELEKLSQISQRLILLEILVLKLSKFTNNWFCDCFVVFMFTSSLHFPFPCIFIWPADSPYTGIYYR